jgi:hypothetical protein
VRIGRIIGSSIAAALAGGGRNVIGRDTFTGIFATGYS